MKTPEENLGERIYIWVMVASLMLGSWFGVVGYLTGNPDWNLAELFMLGFGAFMFVLMPHSVEF